ncbi:MAG: hypothetical protein CVU63_14570, partial [Deltaproteobacteria bacterium HGW-Deltaproteobacteria-20]
MGRSDSHGRFRAGSLVCTGGRIERARADGHRWRARACAILTGIGTVKADDPQLTVRAVPCERQPLRVLIDARLDVSPAARILQGDPIVIATASEDRDKHACLADAG